YLLRLHDPLPVLDRAGETAQRQGEKGVAHVHCITRWGCRSVLLTPWSRAQGPRALIWISRGPAVGGGSGCHRMPILACAGRRDSSSAPAPSGKPGSESNFPNGREGRECLRGK